ncbi:MAG: hypothetical protein R2932_46000 [Caldilineaceae bacterium]
MTMRQRVKANGAPNCRGADERTVHDLRLVALIHSDLHTGGTMLNADDTRVIDLEFGLLWANGL